MTDGGDRRPRGVVVGGALPSWRSRYLAWPGRLNVIVGDPP